MGARRGLVLSSETLGVIVEAECLVKHNMDLVQGVGLDYLCRMRRLAALGRREWDGMTEEIGI
jgi:hypothetical protein